MNSFYEEGRKMTHATLSIVTLIIIICHFQFAVGIEWTVTVYTGTDNYAGTGSKISITIWGTDGYMGQRRLSGEFENGDVDRTTFYESFGKPYKIEIYHDGSGMLSGWQLNRVLITNAHTGASYYFHCECWLDGETRTINSKYPVCKDIPHCREGYMDCRASTTDSICNSCMDPYYGGGYGRGCLQCPSITKCVYRHCTSSSDVKCRRCQDNNIFNRVSSDGRQCDGLCAWNNHYCWPGTCGNGLVKNCNCASGFERTSTPTETSCQLQSLPTIETCSTRAIGPNGEIKMSKATGPTTECQYQSDFYGNFQPVRQYINIFASYILETSSFPPKSSYIDSYNFGITDLTVVSVVKKIGAPEHPLQTIQLLTDNSMSQNVVGTLQRERNISVSGVTLQSGDSTRKDPAHLASPGSYRTEPERSRNVCRWEESDSENCRITKRR